MMDSDLQSLQVGALAKCLGLVPPPLGDRFRYVYVLRCVDDKPYTGYTKDIHDRLDRHKRDSVPSTKNRRSLELETYIGFSDQYQTIEFEKYLKSSSGRAMIFE